MSPLTSDVNYMKRRINYNTNAYVYMFMYIYKHMSMQKREWNVYVRINNTPVTMSCLPLYTYTQYVYTYAYICMLIRNERKWKVDIAPRRQRGYQLENINTQEYSLYIMQIHLLYIV